MARRKYEREGIVLDTEEDFELIEKYSANFLSFSCYASSKMTTHDNVDLMGYTMWGCTDLVSAGTGEMKKR